MGGCRRRRFAGEGPCPPDQDGESGDGDHNDYDDYPAQQQVSEQIKFDVEYLSYECTVFIFVVIVYLRWPQINWTLSISCKKRKVY